VASAEKRESLEHDLDASRLQIGNLNAELGALRTKNADLENPVEELHRLHADEIRTIRFELGEAQQTVAEQERIAGQLASDLVGTRNDRSELENKLSEAENAGQLRIDALEKEVSRLRKAHQESEEKLASKSEAINCLLAELTKKTQRMESIVEIEDVIHDIDDRVATRVGKRAAPDRDRVTRLLIGSVEGQELRFPLFKDRLTIGRTEQNDIQLKANYVSRRHAVVVTDRETTRVIDWGSKNGVFVNGERVTEHFLVNGDTVTIGTADFEYEERPKRDA
jgi:predicted  nucleic acid-binding Zn-ribbon protein